MLVAGMVPECDVDDIKFDAPVEGAWVVSQGATGRWCPVLWVGPEALSRSSQTPITYEEAVAQVEQEGGWADF